MEEGVRWFRRGLAIAEECGVACPIGVVAGAAHLFTFSFHRQTASKVNETFRC